MKIKEIGGEFALIDRIARKAKDKSVVKGVGDDAAVLKIGGKLVLVTTDALVNGDHFSLDWFTPEQVGMKATEINVSDIAAMGGKPKYMLVSLVLTNETEVGFVDGLYKGMRKAGQKYGLEIVGGNITHGRQEIIDVTLIGVAEKKKLCLRNGAKVGDYILCTGKLGGSTAGLNLFLKKKKGFASVKKKHLEPKAELKKALAVASFAHAMEDISDGLASEMKNICQASKVGAVIYGDKVPLARETVKAAQALGKSALDFALFGGEDFELVFTVAKKDLKKARRFGTVVGRIVKGKKLFLESEGKGKEISRRGYDHFAKV